MRITRRTRFALPLVLVVGCSSQPKSVSTPSTPKPPDTNENDNETPPTTENLPDPPGSGKVTKSTTEQGLTLLTYESGDRVYVRNDGTCYAEYSASCGSTVPMAPSTCNPPPPQQVKCPTDAK